MKIGLTYPVRNALKIAVSLTLAGVGLNYGLEAFGSGSFDISREQLRTVGSIGLGIFTGSLGTYYFLHDRIKR